MQTEKDFVGTSGKETKAFETQIIETEYESLAEVDKAIIRARRTAFIARFIVLREGKRTRAHRVIEMMDWDDLMSVEELAARVRQAFVDNGDNMMPVDRDLRRAFAHSQRSLKYFVMEYADRATRSFIESLQDYQRSNDLLFGDDDEEQPKPGGWRLPKELLKLKQEAAQNGVPGVLKVKAKRKVSAKCSQSVAQATV